MKLKIGDLVRFVDEAIEGHVTSFQANELIGVTDETGFEIPVLASKVTLVHGNIPADTDNDNFSSAQQEASFVGEGAFLAVTGDQKQGLATVFFANESSCQILVSISQVNPGGKVSGVYSGIVNPNSAQKVYTANFSNLGKWPTFEVQLLKHTDSLQESFAPISKQVRFRLADLSTSKSRLDSLPEKAWVLQIDKVEEDLKLERLGNWARMK